jgi:hypothetical protein
VPLQLLAALNRVSHSRRLKVVAAVEGVKQLLEKDGGLCTFRRKNREAQM